MTPFLYQIAQLFYQHYGAKISRLVFVFPNRRAGLFFQKYLSELSDKPLFSPVILTVNDLFQRLSGKQTADRISLLFRLYNIYQRVSGSDERFDEFLYWGEMLLGDFDDVDKYRVDAKKLFTNVTDLRTIDEAYTYLSEEQISAIRSFWSSFHPKGDSDGQKQFLALWEILYELYDTFRQELAADGLGYEGMIFREVVERLEQEEWTDFPYERVIFVGLNALSVVETDLLRILQQRGLADFYWDYASDKLTDPNNRASYFARPNQAQFPSAFPLPKEELTEPEIEVIGIPSGIGQAKQVHALLGEKRLTPKQALRTAVVLPDEQLLVPLLSALPEQIKQINVTMGYPLTATPISSLIDYLLSLQQNIRWIDGLPHFSYRDVLSILNHRYVYQTAPDVISQRIREIVTNNRLWMAPQELANTPLLEKLFSYRQEAAGFANYLLDVLGELNRQLEELESANEVEQEFIFHYFALVNRLRGVMQESGVEMRIDTYCRLLKRIAEGVTIPFEGEPLSGLQVMGVLETRALDFDRVIILSMNEGIFPLKKAANSFIPYNLRRGFGLPTYEHQDSVWAYHFYRLISRAKQVSLLYDTRSNGLQTGEVSRFVQQLRYHYEVPVRQKWVVYDVASAQTKHWTIEKTPEVMERLQAFLARGPRALSATAINTYIDCPLKFYFQVLCEVGEEEEVSETIENDSFGSILHKTMELLYEPFCNRMVTADLLEKLSNDEPALTHAIQQAFASEFFKQSTPRTLMGQNYLIGEIIRRYVKEILAWDRKLTPFRYVASEKSIRTTVPIQGGQLQVQLRGFIDRVDEVGGRIRIVDYKSGKKNTFFYQVADLFDPACKDRPASVLQLFLYSWMLSRYPRMQQRDIAPALYSMRVLFEAGFDPTIYQKIDRGVTQPVERIQDYEAEFEANLVHCLEEIFSPELPFVQAEEDKVCVYCAFKGICGR